MNHRNSMIKMKKSIKTPFICVRTLKTKRAPLVSPVKAEQSAESVKKNLDIVLKTAQIEHQNLGFETWRTQNAKLHTYLWLSAAIISAESALLLNIFNHEVIHALPSFCLLFACIVGAVAFIFGIDCLRGRSDVFRIIYGNYEYNVNVAESDISGLRTRREAISALANNIENNAERVHILARKMRELSILNAISAFFGAVAFTWYITLRMISTF